LVATTLFFAEWESSEIGGYSQFNKIKEAHYLLSSVREWFRRKGRILPEKTAVRIFGHSCSQNLTFLVNPRKL
jgi:hypothetical protein